MKNKQIIILLLSTLALPSCMVSANTTSSNESQSSTSVLSTSESSSTSSLSSSEDVKPKDYKLLFDDVYVDILPQILKEETEIHFSFDSENDSLFYKLYDEGEYQELEPDEAVPIKYIRSSNSKDYPLTTSVIPDPTGTGNTDKCCSYDYINNIFKTHNYLYKQKMPVLYLKLEKEDGTIIEKTFTYPIEDDFDLTSIPVISLTGKKGAFYNDSPSDWFYNKITEDLKIRANIEYFDANYDEYFSRETQVKLGGNWSKGYPQRTLNINFNKDNQGNKNDPVTAHVFEETKKENSETEVLSNLTRFRLHNGGNCFEERTGLNDALMHVLMRGTNVSTTAYRPAIVFLNGEYWGYMGIREHYSDVYFTDNYDIKKSNVVLYEYQGGWNFDDGNDEHAEQYLNELLTYVDEHDFTDDNIYNDFINNFIDIDSFIDLFIVQSYASNWDFVGNLNNLKMWRVDKTDTKNPYADGKWRFCLHDIDFACDGSNETLFLSNVDLNANPHHYHRFPMYHKLAQNKNFRMRFIERAQELINTNLSKTNVNNVLTDLYSEVKDFKIESQNRWGKPMSYSAELHNIVNDTKTWMGNRSDNYMGRLRSSLSTWGEIE